MTPQETRRIVEHRFEILTAVNYFRTAQFFALLTSCSRTESVNPWIYEFLEAYIYSCWRWKWFKSFPNCELSIPTLDFHGIYNLEYYCLISVGAQDHSALKQLAGMVQTSLCLEKKKCNYICRRNRFPKFTRITQPRKVCSVSFRNLNMDLRHVAIAQRTIRCNEAGFKAETIISAKVKVWSLLEFTTTDSTRC